MSIRRSDPSQKYTPEDDSSGGYIVAVATPRPQPGDAVTVNQILVEFE